MDQGRVTLDGHVRMLPVAGDHTTAAARSGTLWRDTLRLMLARAKSVKAIHSSDYNTGLERCLRPEKQPREGTAR